MTATTATTATTAVAHDVAELNRWTHGWRRTLMAAGMLTYPVVTAASIPLHVSGAPAVAGFVLVGVFAGCYPFVVLATTAGNWTRFWALLAVQTGLFLATVPIAGVDAFFLGAVVVSMATERTPRYAVAMTAVCVGGCLLVPVLMPVRSNGPGVIQAVMVLFTVLVVHAVARTMQANEELVRARAEVARLASAAERARIARDLHDLLGHSLTAITVKSELARTLVEAGSPRSLREITEVEQLSRTALADVRAAVSGYREVTLAGELARGRELLRACGITADLPTATDLVPGAHQELFGWAVREGLINVARHAQADRCTVTVTAAGVDICDNGVGGPPEPRSGNGLAGLRERAEAAGGTVHAGPAPTGGWRLRVVVGAA